MNIKHVGILFFMVPAFGLEQNNYCAVEKLNCDDTLDEEKSHSASCEILMDALYDLETTKTNGKLANPEDNQTSLLQAQKHVDSTANKLNRRARRLARRGNEQKQQISVDQSSNPPFLPTPNMSEQENRIRLQVCESLLQLPGVRKRCCSTLWVTCPEFGPDYSRSVLPAPNAPINIDGSGILESSSQQGQSILRGIASNFMGMLTNFLNGKETR